MQLAITDPARIAAAAPLASSANASNAGSGVISGVTATDPSVSGFLSTGTILFTSANSFTINGVGPNTYSSSGTIDGNGWSVQVSGTPAAGDRFTVSPNGPDSGDASNAQVLAGLVNDALLNGGNDTVATASAALASKVGAQAQQASLQLTTETAVQTQIQTANSSASGVNLDEEASDMMRFQQAYQAAAQVISTSQTIFQSLLTAMQSS